MNSCLKGFLPATLALLAGCGSPGGLDQEAFPGISDTGYPGINNTAGTATTPPGGGGSAGSASVPPGGGGVAGTGTSGGAAGVGGGIAGNDGMLAGAAGDPLGGGTGGTAMPVPEPSCPPVEELFGRPGAEGGCSGGGGCHDGAILPDLTSPGVGERLLDVSSNCESRPYAGADDSFLADKISGGTPQCGSPMPFLNSGALSEPDRQCILDWLDELALGGG